MKNFIIIACFVCTGLSTAAQNVVQVEYFIDTDAGFGKNSLASVSPASDVSFAIPVDFSTLQPGYHKLYVRTKDNSGIWSLTARRNIEILISEAKTTFTKGEYFFDSDPGFGNGSVINVTDLTDSIILQNFAATASGLSEGYHKLYGRFLDKYGRWGFTFRRNIDIYKSSNTSLINAEYFFDTDLGVGGCSSIVLTNPLSDGSFTISIPRSQIPMGADSLFVRVQDDTENRWSLTQILNNITGTLPLTLLNFTVSKNDGVADVLWQTSNEVGTAYFNVQRSEDGSNFTNIGKIDAHGNTAVTNDYLYSDNLSSIKFTKVFYRLEMVDIDGKKTYSKIVYVNIVPANFKYTIYPNPAHNFFFIKNENFTVVSNAEIIVTDLTGRKLITQKFDSNNSQQLVNISALSGGMYFVTINSQGYTFSQKIIIE